LTKGSNDVSENQELLLSQLYPSPTNPRKSFPVTELNELAGSIQRSGIQVSLLVRPGYRELYESMRPGDEAPDKVYEVVAGGRRFLAAKLADRSLVPCEIRTMTDAEVLEIQIIENLHRADVHPLEEAQGYSYMMLSAEGIEEPDIAARVGKTVAYVVQRMKLLQLEAPARLLFLGKFITLGHAIDLARLTPADQASAVREMLRANHLPKKTDLVAYTERQIKEYSRPEGRRLGRLVSTTEGELKAWIQRNVMLKLRGAPWELGDPDLVPAAGSCTRCPKRSGANIALFGDLTAEEDICLDKVCFASKHKALVKITIAAAKMDEKTILKISARSSNAPLPEALTPAMVIRRGQWIRAGKSKCDAVVQGIVVDAAGQMYESKKIALGETFSICCNQKCKVHKHEVQKPGESGGSRNFNSEEQKLKREAYVKSETPIREAVYAAVAAKAKPSVIECLREYARNGRGSASNICKWGGIPVPKGGNPDKILGTVIDNATADQLAIIIFHSEMVDTLEPNEYYHDRVSHDRHELWAAAKTLKIDPDAIAKKIAADRAKLAAAEPPKPPVAKKKAPKKKSAKK
jgi:ParB family transcriptional regulator, chromosome partitioning protein